MGTSRQESATSELLEREGEARDLEEAVAAAVWRLVVDIECWRPTHHPLVPH